MRIDFSGVEKEIRKDRGRSRHIPEGEYLAKIVDCEARKSERTDSKYLSWKFQITEGAHKGVSIYGITSLKHEALWNLRNLINAAIGKNIAGKAVNFDPDTVIGKVVGIVVEDNEYGEGKDKKVTSRVNTTFPKDEYEAADEDEDEDEDEEDDEEEDDEEESDDEEDLEEVEVEDI